MAPAQRHASKVRVKHKYLVLPKYFDFFVSLNAPYSPKNTEIGWYLHVRIPEKMKCTV